MIHPSMNSRLSGHLRAVIAENSVLCELGYLPLVSGASGRNPKGCIRLRHDRKEIIIIIIIIIIIS